MWPICLITINHCPVIIAKGLLRCDIKHALAVFCFVLFVLFCFCFSFFVLFHFSLFFVFGHSCLFVLLLFSLVCFTSSENRT